jgi:hypothetical protein
MWTAALQRRRLKTKEPEDDQFLFRIWADLQFLIVSLTRLRRSVGLAAKIPSLKTVIHEALADFDKALPMLKEMRDAAEHIDDYAMDVGRNPRVRRQSLEVMVFDDPIFKWLHCELNVDVALVAAQRLFKALQQAKSLVSK